MASASFRESMNSLGWSRRASDLPVNTSQQTGLLSSLRSLNPFGESGYVRLPTTEGAGAPLPAASRREEEEGWFACKSCCLSSTPSPAPPLSQGLQRSHPSPPIRRPPRPMCKASVAVRAGLRPSTVVDVPGCSSDRG